MQASSSGEESEEEGVWRSARVAQGQQQPEQVEEEEQQQEERGKGSLCALAGKRAVSKQDGGPGQGQASICALVSAPKKREATAQGLDKGKQKTISVLFSLLLFFRNYFANFMPKKSAKNLVCGAVVDLAPDFVF